MKRFLVICLLFFSINSNLLLKNKNDEETFPEPIHIDNEDSEEINVNPPYNPSNESKEPQEDKDNDENSNEYPEPIVVDDNDSESDNPIINPPFESEAEEDKDDYINFTEKYASITF
jgi:hypothetical protein